MNDIKIENRRIGQDFKPFIIAEMSGNHNHSLDRALEITKKAASSGVDMLKLQTYTADTMTIDVDGGDFFIDDKESLWYGKNLHALYKVAYTPWEWHEPIMKLAKKLGMLCMSTPFDETAVDFLEELNVPAYKIASFENAHLPLIRKVVSTGKPIIVSTGMATLEDIHNTVEIIRNSGSNNFILLKCTSSYPANPKNSNILTIPHMKNLFNCEVGLSDHTKGIGASIAAIAHGASIIEKHFTLRRSDGGVDSEFSLEPEEMKTLVAESEAAWESLGRINYQISDSERESIKFRRSIYITDNIKKGDRLTTENLKIIRPGFGLKPKYYDVLIGRKVNRDLKRGTPVDWELLD